METGIINVKDEEIKNLKADLDHALEQIKRLLSEKPNTTPPMIFKAMINIMRDVGPIGRNKRNSQQNYNYRGIDDLYNELQPICAKYGVFVLPEVLDTKREERQSKVGGLLIYSILRVKFTFYAEDGSNVSSIVEGEGMDSGDKSTNKAMSGAQKYCLTQTFLIPTEEIVRDDSDAVSPEVGRTEMHQSVTQQQQNGNGIVNHTEKKKFEKLVF